MPELEIVSREEWGARPRQKVYPLKSFTSGWFGHWLGNAYKSTMGDAEIMRAVQDYHLDIKGWYDFAYSFGIGRTATVFEGRGWGIAGGHTEGHNSRSMAVVFLIGQGETPTAEMLNAAGDLLELGEEKGYSSKRIRPHRAVGSTKCPGDDIAKWAIAWPTAERSTSGVAVAGSADLARLDAEAAAEIEARPYASLFDTMTEVRAIYTAHRGEGNFDNAELQAWRTDLAEKIYGQRIDPAETLAFIHHELKNED